MEFDLQRPATRTLQFSAGALGVAAYTFYYRIGEHHLYPIRHVQAVILACVFTVLGLKHVDETLEMSDAVRIAVTLTATYLAGLYTSLAFYRLFLNPLNKFPGYSLAKLTSFDLALRVGGKGDMHLKLYNSHEKWGKFVRIGPNQVSVCHADAVRVALGPQSKCIKSPWYDAEHPATSMLSTRIRAEHDRRRRIWSPAFSDKALRGYELRIARYNQSFIRQIEGFDGKPIDVSKWFQFWGFDIMGDLAFGQSFNMLDSAKSHWAIEVLTTSQEAGGLALPTWAFRLLMAIPGTMNTYRRFVRFCVEQIEDRMCIQGKQATPDIAHFLIEDFNSKTKSGRDRGKELQGLHLDSKLIIVAGSDTTSTAMSFLFYYIARDPGLLERLREEIESLINDGEIEHRKIQHAPLLNGCINEALRLHPPVPSGLHRKAPPEGVYIGEQWIPGNTEMLVNFYSMGRDESNFVDADKFLPERFSTRPELIKHQDAFASFSIGPSGCIGKNLALMEIRLLTAHLVTKFDVALAPGENGYELLNSYDHFVTGLRPLHLVFKRRSLA
ncbi:cytochrome P450 [Aspergillus lucknowensis]|uniref:Cytochrome P450 n=1 Tax=Aspergillus lucknowensis TaxID=176173 RepID=A0ABR4L8I9_9EURO